MRRRLLHIILGILILALAACSLPLSPRATSPGLQASVAAQARPLVNGASTLTAPPLPVTGGTAAPTAVQVGVTSPTNCRTGPGVVYDLVFLASPGQSFVVVGKYTPDNYWIIATASGGTCWLWGRYAVLSGNTDSLPEASAPLSPLQGGPAATSTVAAIPTATDTLGPPPTDTPTPTAGPTVPPVLPGTPGNLSQSYVCSTITSGSTPETVQDISLTWRDAAHETGYRIYQNGIAITTLPQNTTSYHIQLRYNQGTGAAAGVFGVEAYNNAGASQRVTIDVPRCP